MTLDDLIKQLQEQAAERGGDTLVLIHYPYRNDYEEWHDSYDDVSAIEFHPKPPNRDARDSYTGAAVIIDVD